MSRSITLFSGYSQKENRTTNYSLLILRMLYEENPKFLAEVLSPLFGLELGDYIGVGFYQQQRKKSGIPDGVIRQRAFTIYIETKNFDWFYDSQLERHLDDLVREEVGLKLLLALGNFESVSKARFSTVESLCHEKFDGKVQFAYAGFDELVEAMQGLKLPKNLDDAVADFSDYLDQEGLLPTWKSRLDVVNCAGKPDEIRLGKVYMCPTTGGAYNHRRSRFFGMYKDKAVRLVSEIYGLVELSSEVEAKAIWNNGHLQEPDLIKEARSRHTEYRPGRFPSRVFVLGEQYETNFMKASAPMRTSKQYFQVDSESAEDLARFLNGKIWPTGGGQVL